MVSYDGGSTGSPEGDYMLSPSDFKEAVQLNGPAIPLDVYITDVYAEEWTDLVSPRGEAP